jgi:glycosyltransferase involved in cell wall biosynthesis
MKLQILIPQYKETEEIIKPLLDSIAIQQNVDLKNDVGVIIVNDGTDVILSKKFLSSYPFKIEYYKNEHKGVSATRNACLDHATADYVMFCDADDMFCNVCGLWIIFREMSGSGFDSLTSVFMEEGIHPETKERIYIHRGNMQSGGIDSTFVHGKVHRRKYLINNNIRWDEDLTIHEDSYFNCLCQKLSKEVKYCPTPFYLWKWRDDSVCRRDPKYILKTLPNMILSNSRLVQQFIDRNMLDEAKFYATSMIFDAYYSLNCKQWLENENKEYRDILEKKFKEYYLRFEPQFKEVDPKVRYQIVALIRNRFFQEGLELESMTFDQWINHILTEVE